MVVPPCLPLLPSCPRRRASAFSPPCSPSLSNPRLTSRPRRKTPVPPARCDTPLAASPPWCPGGLSASKRFAQVVCSSCASPLSSPSFVNLSASQEATLGLLKGWTMTNSLCVGWRTKRRAWVEGDMHARFIQQEERRANAVVSRCVMRCSSQALVLIRADCTTQGQRSLLLPRVVNTMACTVVVWVGCVWCVALCGLGMGRRLGALRRWQTCSESRAGWGVLSCLCVMHASQPCSHTTTTSSRTGPRRSSATGPPFPVAIWVKP